MASDFTWPKPWLLTLYERAVEEGCIRIRMRGETDEECEREWKSFHAAFNRMKRKRDASYVVQMRPEFQFVQVRYEPKLRKALIAYDALPDGEVLPEVESVDGKHPIPQPRGSQPHETPEESPDDFDATEHVSKLIENLDVEDEGGADEL